MDEQPVDEALILATCLEDVEAGRLSIEECLNRYPETAPDLGEMLRTVKIIQDSSAVKLSATFRQQARSRLITQLQPWPATHITFFDTLRHRWQHTFVKTRSRRFGMAWMLLFVVIALLLLGAGTAYASDAAVPGQSLYTLDRSLEEFRTDLTKDPEASVLLQLAFAEERLSEAQELTGGKGSGNFQDALSGYGENLSSIVNTISTVGFTDRERLGQLLDEALSDHNAKLLGLAISEEQGEQEGDAAVSKFCADGQPHPVAQGMAVQYAVDTKQIMDWFCGSGKTPGFGFGQIMLALQEEAQLGQAGPSAQEILSRRASGEGWGQIWRDLGSIGKPKEDALPDRAGQKGKRESSDEVGPPDHAGPKDKEDASDGSGPPDRAGPKDKTDSSEGGGPPDHAGPKDREDPSDGGGPPDHALPEGKKNSSKGGGPPGKVGGKDDR